MSDIFNYIFNLQVKNNTVIAQLNGVNKGVIDVRNSVNNLNNTFQNSFTKIQKRIGSIEFSSILQQVNAVADGLNQLSGPGNDFTSSMADLSAMTGITVKGLQQIGAFARQSAKDFGTSASEGLDSYKIILSKLNPELAKSPKALAEMGKSVNTLSKQMGGNTVSAAETLTTALNQFQISTADPIAASREMAKMMNVMSAAAQAGSAELPDIKEALEQTGLSAKTANVSFAETNAAIQVLDKAGRKGAEGGVALRNVMSTLAQGRFLPPDVIQNLQSAGVDITALTDKGKTLAQRLEVLKPVMNDSALFTKLFGRENANAAIALVSQTGELSSLTKEIQGTNSAYDQAAIIMQSPAQKAAILQAKINDLKISMFNATGGALGYMGVLSSLGQQIFYLAPLYKVLSGGVMKSIQVVNWLRKAENLEKVAKVGSAIATGVVTVATTLWTGAQWALNAAFIASPIGWIVLGVGALVAGIVLAWKKFEGFRKVVMGVWEVMKSFGSILKDLVIDRIKTLLSGITGLGKAFMELFQGHWQKAWETGKNAVLDLTGVTTMKHLKENAGKNKGKIAGAWTKGNAEGAASWVKSHQKVTPATTTHGAMTKITSPVVPGASTSPTGSPTTTQTSGGSAAGAKTANAIATGGTKNTVVNITIGSLVKDFKVMAGNIEDAADKIRDRIVDEMTRAVSMGASLGAG